MIGLIAILVFAGIGLSSRFEYLKKHTHTLYEVVHNEQAIGLVSDPDIVNQYILNLQSRLEEQYPDVHIVVDSGHIAFEKKDILDGEPQDKAVLKRLQAAIGSHAVGVALKVDGQTVGIVKDQATADRILDQIKAPFVSEDQPLSDSKTDKGKVRILSASSKPEESSPDVLSRDVGFVQKVEQEPIDIQPNQFSNPDQVAEKLKTGGVQPVQYEVQQGDCISCIAHKFHISEQVIYDNNSWIKGDFLNIGDKLNLTVYKPLLSTRTVEQIRQTVDVPFPEEYTKDETLLRGVVKTVRPGKNGKKVQIVEMTKIDGIERGSKVISEQVTEPPVAAQYLEGTRVISGLGTGHLRWPVDHHKITRGFGWQKAIFVAPNAEGNEFHEGDDIVSSTGNRNILAADTGKVIFVGTENGYGNCVKIDHLNGYVTFYAHLSKSYVKVGQIVEQGQTIAYMGSTGWATGIHLHFGVYRNGKLVDPINYLGK